MSEFFKSELVRGEIQEMTSLQEFCFRCAMNLSLLDNEKKLEDESFSEFTEEKEVENKTDSNISKFALNLNEEALQGRIDPVIGRENELVRITQILARRFGSRQQE